MATRTLAFPIVVKQNTNTFNSGYGKWYGETYNLDQPLNLKGLANRVAMDQSVLTPEICQGVIDRLTTTMSELLKEGQAISWDGLGIFRPTVENNGGVSDPAGYDVNTNVKGIHIRFVPTNVKGEELTSRQYADTLNMVKYGSKVTQKVRTASGNVAWKGNIRPAKSCAATTNLPLMTHFDGASSEPYMRSASVAAATGVAIKAAIDKQYAGLELTLKYGDMEDIATDATVTTATVDDTGVIDFAAAAITGTTGKKLYVVYTKNGKQKTVTYVDNVTLT